MQLALGTVQFGQRYGVAGRSTPVSESEIRSILACALAFGVRVLDTAAAYGNIEERLLGLANGGDFKIVTKLPPRPQGLGRAENLKWIDDALQSAQRRLGTSLYAVLFHRAEDLLDDSADGLWQGSAEWTQRQGCKLGVSCYDAATLDQVRRRFPIGIAQLPCNALDQRLRGLLDVDSSPLELHIRSAFLQGLLLMPEAAAAARVPRAAPAIRRWHAWLREHSLAPLSAALGLVKGLQGVSHCVVGVDDEIQFRAIATAWNDAPPLRADELSVEDLDVIDPRRWTVQA